MTVSQHNAAVPLDAAPTTGIPLCVDLDGTLIRSDMLVEMLFALLKQKPSLVFRLPLWLLRGRSHLKQQLASHVEIDPAALPYNAAFLAYIKERRAAGQPLVLMTASPESISRQIAAYLGIFDDVVGSDGKVNLKGARKLEAIRARYDVFDYAGDARADLTIWPHARRAILVEPALGVVSAGFRRFPIAKIFPARRSLKAYLRAIRLQQWIKNVLVFAPLFSSHRVLEPGLWMREGVAALAFGLGASAIYLFNDLFDLTADRLHPRKRRRPMASGDVSVWHAVALIPVLLAGSAFLSLGLPVAFRWDLSLYAITALAYSYVIKRHEMMDVIVLASLWTIRIIAGAAAIQVSLSSWLLAFSMFIFLSLALVKRCSEVFAVRGQGRSRTVGRDYRFDDLSALASFGIGSGFAAVLVLARYISSADIYVLYRHPQALWLLCPILLYWLMRVWIKTWRGEMHDDPIVFALTDRASRWLLAAAGAVVYAATFSGTLPTF